MNELRYTLLSDGSSDRTLIPILSWLLRQHLRACALRPAWADLRRLPNPPKDLDARIRRSIDLYPCELLFVHRDAETNQPQKRFEEIRQAISKAMLASTLPPAICVVPVRMTEAWLLSDLRAVRRAAGNPNGRKELSVPDIRNLEDLPNPKDDLHRLLREASELKGRRLKDFSVKAAACRVSEYIEDFASLRTLPAFARLDEDIVQTIGSHGWAQ